MGKSRGRNERERMSQSFRSLDPTPASPASIVSLNWPFDNLGFLSEKLRQMLLYVVRSQMHRLISTSLVLKHAEGRALAVAGIKPIVTHKPVRILNDWHEFLAYPAVNLCAVLWIKMIMTNNGKHDASPSLNFPISTFFCEDDLCVAFRVKLESALPVPKGSVR